MVLYSPAVQYKVRMAEWSKALRSGRSPLLWAWVRIPLLTKNILVCFGRRPFTGLVGMTILSHGDMIAEWRSGSVLGP